MSIWKRIGLKKLGAIGAASIGAYGFMRAQRDPTGQKWESRESKENYEYCMEDVRKALREDLPCTKRNYYCEKLRGRYQEAVLSYLEQRGFKGEFSEDWGHLRWEPAPHPSPAPK